MQLDELFPTPPTFLYAWNFPPMMTCSERAGSATFRVVPGTLAGCGVEISGLETRGASQAALGKGVCGSMYVDVPDNYISGVTVQY